MLVKGAHWFTVHRPLIFVRFLTGSRTMGASIHQSFTNALAIMIAEHEGETLASQSEVALYRVRAQELRQESVQTSWPDVRERVLALAEQYDLLADSLERSGASGASQGHGGRAA